MRVENILQTIGNTPHVRINRLFGPSASVWVKSERSNPGGSVKDRIALAMVEDAEKSGALQPGGTIIEPTSGNTGIGLALVAAVKGYKLILVMPDSMSIERRRLMLAYGAQFDLTPLEKGMKGAIARAEELKAQTPGSWIPQQFETRPTSTRTCVPRRRKFWPTSRADWMHSSPAWARAATSRAQPACSRPSSHSSRCSRSSPRFRP